MDRKARLVAAGHCTAKHTASAASPDLEYGNTSAALRVHGACWLKARACMQAHVSWCIPSPGRLHDLYSVNHLHRRHQARLLLNSLRTDNLLLL